MNDVVLCGTVCVLHGCSLSGAHPTCTGTKESVHSSIQSGFLCNDGKSNWLHATASRCSQKEQRTEAERPAERQLYSTHPVTALLNYISISWVFNAKAHAHNTDKKKQMVLKKSCFLTSNWIERSTFKFHPSIFCFSLLVLSRSLAHRVTKDLNVTLHLL